MKTHTSQFKENIAQMGRQIHSIITYNNTTLEEELYSVTPLFEGNILKSIMKQLDILSSVDIPIDTVVNYQLGVLVNGEYEYLDYGNYVVVKSEKQEDTNKYKITCYDKLVYSMKQNEDLGITYPITIKNYLTALANKIGLTVKNTSFYNQDLYINQELYAGLEYTYRDILDEIAQATGSIICINKDDEIEVKYPNITGDTINGAYLKDINVNFEEKYGPINSIVLSRAGESDNVYIQDHESIAQNGLCEVKIVDNQIMNWNDRSDYLEGLLGALDGLEYYINDFESTGILYYDPYDIYNIEIGENNYKCIMLNDEIDITSGIKELIHTDMPEQSETDYEKADKTDRRLNQTYIIVDKQNQIIDSVVSNVETQDNKISQITQTVDEINQKISDIADITVTAEDTDAKVELERINTSEPILLKVHPVVTNISYLYPRINLYPMSNLYMTVRTIRFLNTKVYIQTTDTKYTDYKKYFSYDDQQDEYTLLIAGTDYTIGDTILGTTYENKYIDYELPDDLLYYDSENYDEFYLDYDNQTCQISKKCEYNADGTVSLLSIPTTETYEYPLIELDAGDYEVSIVGYASGYIKATLMAENIYTTQFYTKVETDSRINQKADEITLGVSQTLSNYSTTNQMNSAINLKAGEITSTVSQTYETKDNAQTNYSQITQTTTGLQTQVSQKVGNNEVISKINQSSESITINANRINLARKNNKYDIRQHSNK